MKAGRAKISILKKMHSKNLTGISEVRLNKNSTSSPGKGQNRLIRNFLRNGRVRVNDVKCFFINYSVLLFNIFNFLRHRDKIGISANFPEFQSHNFQSRSRSRSERKGFCRDSIQNLVISRKFWKYIFILQFSLYKRGSSSPKTILVPQLGLKMDPGTGICCGDFFITNWWLK